MKAHYISNKISKRLKIAIFLSTVSLFSALVYIIHHTYAYITPPALIYIPDKNSTSSLLKELKYQKVPINILDYRLLKQYPYPKSGWVRFDPDTKLTRDKLIKQIHKNRREKRTRRIVMYGGDSIELFAKRVAKQTNLSSDSIIKEYRRLSPYHDGGIMAGYYLIPYKTTPTAIIYFMLHSSGQKFKQIAQRYGLDPESKKWEEILVVASIIQKETQNSKEMPLISSVIYNRLKQDIKLQLDATLNYGKYSNIAVTPKRIKSDKSRYNTYIYKGLPPHPISSVTKDAIIAAIDPLNTDYLYFMLADNGTHNFASTYKEHLSNIRWYQMQRDKNGTDQNSTNKTLDTIPEKVTTAP